MRCVPPRSLKKKGGIEQEGVDQGRGQVCRRLQRARAHFPSTSIPLAQAVHTEQGAARGAPFIPLSAHPPFLATSDRSSSTNTCPSVVRQLSQVLRHCKRGKGGGASGGGHIRRSRTRAGGGWGRWSLGRRQSGLIRFCSVAGLPVREPASPAAVPLTPPPPASV